MFRGFEVVFRAFLVLVKEFVLGYGGRGEVERPMLVTGGQACSAERRLVETWRVISWSISS